MAFQYASVLFGLLFGAAFVLMNVAVINRILSPRGSDPARSTVYECGEPAIGSAWVRFDMRFYTVALVFLIFDVEVLVLFPWAVVYNDLVTLGGLFAFVEVALFVAILGVGLIYVWMKGDLEWVKATSEQPLGEEVRVPAPVPAEPSLALADAGADGAKPQASA